MDHLASREKELEVDLESGGTTSEEDGTNDQFSANGQTNKIFNGISTGHFGSDGSVKGNCGMNLHSNSPKLGEAVNENVELFLDKNSEDESKENVASLGKKSLEGKCKKANPRKPPRPPRPPRGPSLDAADQKLVRELADLAMRKRARIDRIKTLKKMKAAKASNSYSNLSAMIITLIFCLVIIFQGIIASMSLIIFYPVFYYLLYYLFIPSASVCLYAIFDS